MNNHPEYSIKSRNDKAILIKDLAEYHRCMSITNGAEEVVRNLSENGVLGDRRLFYIDTMGDTDELLHENGVFKGFQFGDKEEIRLLFR